jgi:diamine N-acetyltransferase
MFRAVLHTMSELNDGSIRLATVADATLLAEIGESTFFETFAADNTEEDMAEYLATNFNYDQQLSELSDPMTMFLIVRIGDAAAGYAMLRIGPPPDQDNQENMIELVRLYVRKQWHGRAVGGTLMKACLARAAELGFSTLWLGVWEHNARARAFYRKWQFEEFGEHIFHLGGDAQNDILMRRPVSDKL